MASYRNPTQLRRPIYYLATPYRAYQPEGREFSNEGERYREAADEAQKWAALFLQAGVPTFSPIQYTHALSSVLQDSHEAWLEVDHAFVDSSKVLIVMQMPGWDNSDGIRQEILWAKKAKKYIYMVDPADPVPAVHHMCINYPGGPMGAPLLRQRRQYARKMCVNLQEGIIDYKDWRTLIELGPQTSKKRY